MKIIEYATLSKEFCKAHRDSRGECGFDKCPAYHGFCDSEDVSEASEEALDTYIKILEEWRDNNDR